MNDADICRKNNWTVGTVLEGDEGYGMERIVITAIGETHICARSLNGGREVVWTLAYRDWKKVP